MEQQGNKIDQELISRLREGDKTAFDFIYYQYSHKLFSFVYKILKSKADTEEVVQEVFVRIWENKNRLSDASLLNSYLFTIAYNQSISLIRKKISGLKYLEHLKNASLLSSAPSQIDELEWKELSTRLEHLIESLPERQKQVYLLHRNDGLTYLQIAERLGISVNTVENHMSRALGFLRAHLGDSLLMNFLFIHLFL